MIVARHKQAHEGAELFDMARKTASFAIQSRYIAAQVGVGSLHGISLLFAPCHIMAGRALALPIDQLLIGGESIAVELMHPGTRENTVSTKGCIVS